MALTDKNGGSANQASIGVSRIVDDDAGGGVEEMARVTPRLFLAIHRVQL